MLNRVLDRTIKPSVAVQTLIERSLDALPTLLAALQGGQTGNVDLSGIMAAADRLAAGEMAALPDAPPRHTRTVKRLVQRRLPVAPVAKDDVAAEVAGKGRTLRDIDPVLFDILNSEVANHLASIDHYLDECAATAVPVAISQALLRAVHTLNGAIAMVDMPVIGQVLAPLEGYVRRLCARREGPGSEGIAVLGETSALVRDVMQRHQTGVEAMPDAAGLAARVTALRDVLPEPESPISVYSDVSGTEDSELEDVLADSDDDQFDPMPVTVASDAEAGMSDPLAIAGIVADPGEEADAAAEEDLTASLVRGFSDDDAAVDALAADALAADAAVVSDGRAIAAAAVSEWTFFDPVESNAELDVGLASADFTSIDDRSVARPPEFPASDEILGTKADRLDEPADVAASATHVDATTAPAPGSPPEADDVGSAATAIAPVELDAHAELTAHVEQAEQEQAESGAETGIDPADSVHMDESVTQSQSAAQTGAHEGTATIASADHDVARVHDEAKPASAPIEVASQAQDVDATEPLPRPQRATAGRTAPIAEDPQPDGARHSGP